MTRARGLTLSLLTHRVGERGFDEQRFATFSSLFWAPWIQIEVNPLPDPKGNFSIGGVTYQSWKWVNPKLSVTNDKCDSLRGKDAEVFYEKAWFPKGALYKSNLLLCVANVLCVIDSQSNEKLAARSFHQAITITSTEDPQ